MRLMHCGTTQESSANTLSSSGLIQPGFHHSPVQHYKSATTPRLWPLYNGGGKRGGGGGLQQTLRCSSISVLVYSSLPYLHEGIMFICATIDSLHEVAPPTPPPPTYAPPPAPYPPPYLLPYLYPPVPLPPQTLPVPPPLRS